MSPVWALLGDPDYWHSQSKIDIILKPFYNEVGQAACQIVTRYDNGVVEFGYMCKIYVESMIKELAEGLILKDLLRNTINGSD